MKRYRFLFLLLLLSKFCSYESVAQNSFVLDSLYNVLKENSPDTIKIDIYRELYFEYMYEDHEQSLNFIKKAVTLSNKINDKKRSSLSYLNLGNYYWKRGKLLDANTAFDSVRKRLLYFKNDRIQTTLFLEQAIVKYYEGIYAESIQNYFKAISGYEKLGDTLGVAKCYNNIGAAYRELENLDMALKHYLKALYIYKEKNYKQSIGRTLGNIGLIYNGKGNYEKALEYYHQSLTINRKNEWNFDVAMNLQNIGAVYKKNKDYQKALTNYNEAYKISKKLGDSTAIMRHSHSVSGINLELGNYNTSLQNLKEALKYAQKLNMKVKVKDIYLSFSLLYEKMGKHKKALEFQRLFEIRKDSILNEKNLMQINELQTKYETVQKDKEIDLLTKENLLQEATSEKEATLRKTLIAGLILLVIIGSLIFYTMRQRLRNQKMMVEKNEEIKRSQYREQLQTLEMKALRAQMNPHFLFNSLNSINTMIISDENDNASKYLSKFSKLVRLMLENSEQPRVSLKDEISMLEAYVQLEALRFNNKIGYKIDVDETIDQDTTYIPSMVLQPFVENAIWHGLLHKDTKGMLTITIREDSDKLYCSIIDNGIGRDNSLTLQKEGGLKKKSMGIKITTARLKLLTRQKINEVIAIIDLKDDNNNALGTQVNIQIPLS